MKTGQSTITREPPALLSDKFQSERVLVIAGGHFAHDIFTSFLAPLLPLIIEKLGLSLTLTGVLASFQRFP